MNISYNWLRKYINTPISVDEVSAILTNIGLEVEGVEKIGGKKDYLDKVIIGEVLSAEKHNNADKLKVTQIDFGNGEPVQIVCGAPNVAAGQKVAVATVGTQLPTADGESFTIKKAKIRGEESNGMICSEVELGIGEDNSGILVLPNDYQAGKSIQEYISTEEDYLIEIGLTPNRADAMSHYGVARDLYAALKVRGYEAEFIPYDLSNYPTENFGDNPIKSSIKNTEAAPRYASVYLKNIHVQPSPEWLQTALRTIGLTPVNNVVDIANFVMHDLGQPLHTFDADKISGQEVVVDLADEGTKFTTLDGTERTLKGHELMISDAEKPMCIAGVFGGKNSGVTNETTSLFVESAYFDPVTIRKGAKAHALNTDASFRFERGIDPTLTIDALKKAVLLLVEYANAEIASNIEDFYPKAVEDFPVTLRYKKINQLLGMEIPTEKIKEIFTYLEIKTVKENDEQVEVLVPAYRVDVQREVDLIEEILRLYGYDNIAAPEKVSFSIIPSNKTNPEKIEDFVARELNTFGFHEAMNNSLMKREYEDLFHFPEGEFVEMLNPLSADLAVMRRSLITGLLENVVFNVNRKNKNIKLYEFGKIYTKLNNTYQESKQLALVVSGDLGEENWTKNQRKASFYDLKGVLNQIFERLGLRIDLESPTEDPNLQEGIRLMADGKELGYAGIVDQKLLKKIDLNQAVFYAQLHWDVLLSMVNQQPLKYKEISKFPGSRRDLALLLPQSTTYEELYNAAFGLKNDLLKAVHLFDVYEGDKLPAGKKSYALSFQFRDDQKTLSDAEVDKVMKKLIHLYENDFGASLR